MKKLTQFVLTFLFLLTLSSTFASASLVTVDKKGDLIWNVLGVTEGRELTVNEVVGGLESQGPIFLKKEEDKITLQVGDRKSLDITTWDKDVVEIEERGDTKKVKILVVEGNFVIVQEDVQAKTAYPINIDPKENELSLLTDSGSIYLSILPVEAVETSIRSKFISKLSNKNLEIEEKEVGVLAYKVSGEKVIDLLNLAKFNISVTTFVSTTTGEILSVDQPKWLSILGFMFS